MKVLHINASDIGSTGKIVQDISHVLVKNGHEAVALFPKRNREPDPDLKEYVTAYPLEQGIYRRLCRLWGHQYGFAPVATARILRILRKEKPDIVHLHCINGHCVNIYRLLSYLKTKAIPTVVTNHAEFFYTGNCPHAFDCEGWKTGCHHCQRPFETTGCKTVNRTNAAWKKMKKAFAGHPNLHIVSVSPWVYSRSSQSPILEGIDQSTVLNGINPAIFTYKDKQEARLALGLDKDETILLHTTANFSAAPNDSKGGRYLIALAEQLKAQGIRFIVAGRHNVSGPIPENMTLLGRVDDQRVLADYYAAADLTVLVSQRETFGMAVAESLCCGTPVAGFVSGGSESIAIPGCSRFVPYADVAALKAQICQLLEESFDRAEIAGQAKEKYADAVMAEGYIRIYETLLKEGVL